MSLRLTSEVEVPFNKVGEPNDFVGEPNDFNAYETIKDACQIK